MAEKKSTWTVVLRCYDCKRRFSGAGVPMNGIALIPQAAPCAHCAAKSVIVSGRHFGAAGKLHQILDLRKDRA